MIQFDIAHIDQVDISTAADFPIYNGYTRVGSQTGKSPGIKILTPYPATRMIDIALGGGQKDLSAGSESRFDQRDRAGR